MNKTRRRKQRARSKIVHAPVVVEAYTRPSGMILAELPPEMNLWRDILTIRARALGVIGPDAEVPILALSQAEAKL